MTAEKVASQIGIERVFAEVMPADKASYVKSFSKKENSRRWLAMG